jgi:Skp family chaperone for outer membrane proteins
MYRLSGLAVWPLAVLLLSVGSVPGAAPASAQDYFVPGAPRPAQQVQPQAPRSGPRPPTVPRPAPQPQLQPPPPSAGGVPVPDAAGADQTLSVQLPPIPELPALPRVAPPPTPVIGVMGVPEVMRSSTAAQTVDRVIGERRQRLSEDFQKEQAAWHDLQQTLTSQRGTMSPEQIRTKERELQDRITTAQQSFRERNRVIQEAAQASAGQIERVLVAVIRQVADSHGMNLVLHREQVALNISDFDITEQVAAQLNKIMPSVDIAPDSAATPAAAPANPPSVLRR